MQTLSNFHIAFHSERTIHAQAVRTLYDGVNWWPQRHVEAITQVLDRDIAIGVWHDVRLIGFARAVTDGVFRAYIEDVVVHPTYRQQRLAVTMVAHLIDHLNHIETISLFCTPELIGLYEAVGFKARPTQVVMHRAGTD